MSEQQKFLLWQYAELCSNIKRAQLESNTEEIVKVMLAEKTKMENGYEALYGEKPALPPPLAPQWWF